MEGSVALMSDDVKSVSITGTERTPCAKRRCRRKRARAVNASQDGADGTATTAEFAVDGATSLLVEMADLDSEELDWSLPSLIAEQTEDLELKHICAMMAVPTNRPSTEETLPPSAIVKSFVQQWERLAMRSGLLHRRWESADGLKISWQWIPPLKYRRPLIRVAHTGMTGGHLGIERTHAQVQRRAYWSGWKSDVRLEVLRCNECARYHRGQPPRQAGLRPMVVGEPWERIGIDITGRHPRSSSGYEYMLTVMDQFS